MYVLVNLCTPQKTENNEINGTFLTMEWIAELEKGLEGLAMNKATY